MVECKTKTQSLCWFLKHVSNLVLPDVPVLFFSITSALKHSIKHGTLILILLTEVKALGFATMATTSKPRRGHVWYQVYIGLIIYVQVLGTDKKYMYLSYPDDTRTGNE